MTQNRQRKLLFFLAAAAGFSLGRMAYHGNYRLERSDIDVRSRYLPPEMDGLCIVHISDLHNASFGKKNRRLLKMIEEAEPDIIVMTGDLVDSRRTNLRVALEFMKDARKIAPVYFVPGNHEARLRNYSYLDLQLRRLGVTVFHNNSAWYEKNGAKIRIIGLDDHRFQIQTDDYESTSAVVDQKLRLNADPQEGFEIVLIHRPEFFPLLVRYGIDLVFSGHVHGGQIRLPLIGGLAAPGQHGHRHYISGMYCEGRTTMLQSRGLGNSLFPIRINNHPEVGVAHLYSGGNVNEP